MKNTQDTSAVTTEEIIADSNIDSAVDMFQQLLRINFLFKKAYRQLKCKSILPPLCSSYNCHNK
jgi:hypothetical protein